MQITDHIHALKIPFMSAGAENKTVERFVYVFLIYGEKICIIDGGVSASFPRIVDYLKKTARSIEEIISGHVTSWFPNIFDERFDG